MEIQQDAISSSQEPLSILEFIKQDASQEESNIKNTSSIQIIQTENETDNKQVSYTLKVWLFFYLEALVYQRNFNNNNQFPLMHKVWDQTLCRLSHCLFTFFFC